MYTRIKLTYQSAAGYLCNLDVTISKGRTTYSVALVHSWTCSDEVVGIPGKLNEADQAFLDMVVNMNSQPWEERSEQVII